MSKTFEQVKEFDLGIAEKVSFSATRRQGLHFLTSAE